jgi:hypothetical protein
LLVLTPYLFAEALYTRHHPRGLGYREDYYGFLGAAAMMEFV